MATSFGLIMKAKFLLFFLVLGPLLKIALVANAAPPTIDYQPQSQEVILYQQAAFGVIASGGPPLSYQWLKNGAPIPNATNDQIVIPQSQFSDEGLYSVIVSNIESSVTSTNAELTVRLPKAGDLDGSFVSGGAINGAVRSVSVQLDGRVLTAGDFTTLYGAARGRIARLATDGTTDYTFMNGLSGANNVVYSIAVQDGGKVLVAGGFSAVNGISRTGIARLNADGTLDNDFEIPISGTAHSIVLQNDGKALIGGSFISTNDLSHTNIIRLNTNGTFDTGFQGGFSGITQLVISLAVQLDGKILVGTQSTTTNAVNQTRIVRLNSDGTLDDSFQSTFSKSGYLDAFVSSIAVQQDGKVIIGGQFDRVNGTSRTNFVRLNANGGLDSSFQNAISTPDYVSPVTSVALQNDGKVLVGGYFTTARNPREHIVRVNTDGSLDSQFQSKVSGVYSITLQIDGKLIIGGVRRLNSDGTLDSGFGNGDSPVVGEVYSIAVQPDDKAVLGGWFTGIHGVQRSAIARLHADGSLDGDFQTEFSPAYRDSISVDRISVQSDGKILIAGWFTAVNGVTRTNFARLNADGTLDGEFQTTLFNAADNYPYVNSIALQSDGKVLIGGSFTEVNGTNRSYFARLNLDGTLDNDFLDGLSGPNAAPGIAVQNDGKLLIAGAFTQVNGTTRQGIARLNTDGTLDDSFQAELSLLHYDLYNIDLLAVQSDGKVLIEVRFYPTNYMGPPTNIVARLNIDGSLDSGFQTELSQSLYYDVTSTAVQKDGKILLTSFTWTGDPYPWGSAIARLNSNGSWDTNFRMIFGPQTGKILLHYKAMARC